MGSVDGDGAETLDQGMWARDSDEEEEQPNEGQETGMPPVCVLFSALQGKERGLVACGCSATSRTVGGQEIGETELGAKMGGDTAEQNPQGPPENGARCAWTCAP
jgi:hypothetical protein